MKDSATDREGHLGAFISRLDQNDDLTVSSSRSLVCIAARELPLVRLYRDLVAGACAILTIRD